MFRLDRNGAYLDVKAEQSASLVAPVSELLGRTVRDVLPAPVADQLLQAANRALNGDGMQTFEYRLDVMQGPREFESRIVANGADETISIVRDVTERKRAEQELRFRGELLDQATVAIMATDAKGIVSHWNRHSEQLYGWTRDEVIGRPIGEITVGPAEAETAAGILANLAAGVPWEGQFVCQRKDGTRVPVHIVDSPVRNEQGEVIGIVGVSYDVSERQNFERRLSHLAFHDALTGLPNRSRFLERLNEALNRAARNHGPVIILFLDLDRFKVLNDSFGHGAGDGVLLQVGRRLADSLRLGDLIARFGGDEFVVLPAAGANPEDAGLIAERLLTVLETPFEVDGRETFLGGSIGIAVTGPTITTAEQLLRAADIALYEAKGAGRGQWALYDDVVGERARRRLELESDLRHALVRGDFELHYQPLIDLASDVLYGFEALLRWRHPERGLVSPAEFLPVAEETGLIEPIGEWVLAEACRQAAQWQALRPERPLVMSVNVSPRQVHGPAFGHALWRVLSETGLAPHRLKLEVTEAALAIDDAITVAFLHAARALGVQVALDDFGTGYSSLGRLHTLPLDVLKIDRSFIARLGHDPQAEAIVRAVVMLGHELGLSVTAEGIETEEQRRRVFALGCDRGQGYLFARPLTAEAASAWLIEPVAGDALDAVR
jgi:Amt family ammonium transporter